MAKSAARKRFSGASGSPLKISSPPAGTSAAKTIDPFAESVKVMKLQLDVLQATAAVKKLSDGDPDAFIPMAEERMRSGDTSYPWASLIRQAKQKIDEQEWADGIKDGSRTLESFKKHVEGQLASYSAGSPEAAQALKNLAVIGTSIKAKAEAEKDQAALAKYIDGSDHKAYRDYLTGKLGRTVDPALQTKVVSNIEELDKRIAAAASVERAKKVTDALVAFRNGASVAETVNKLTTIAEEKSTSAAEVNHIQNEIDAVFNKAAADIKAGNSARSAAASQAQTVRLNQESTALQNAKEVIERKLKVGLPITQEDLRNVDTAAAAVEWMNEAVANSPSTTASAARTANNEAEAAGKAPFDVRGLIDAKTKKDFGLDEAGLKVFKDGLNGLSATKQAEAWIDRAIESNLALGKLHLDDNKKVAVNDSAIAYGMGRRQVTELTKPVPLGTEGKGVLHDLYMEYKRLRDEAELPAVSETNFMKALESTTPQNSKPGVPAGPAGAAAKLGIETPAGIAQWETMYDGAGVDKIINRGAKYDVSDAKVIGDPESSANLEAAMSLQDRLIRAQFGKDKSLSRSALYYTATGEVSPMDAVNSMGQGDARKRRGGLSDGDMPIPGERSEQNTPVWQQPESSPRMASLSSSSQEDYFSGGGDAMLSDGMGGGLGGYISDQRQELFGNQDAYQGATSYLTQNSFVDLPAWSMPEMPAWDPIVSDYGGRFGEDRDLYFGDYGNDEPILGEPPTSTPPAQVTGSAYFTE